MNQLEQRGEVEIYSLFFGATGANVSYTYPTLLIIDFLEFPRDYWVLGFQFSSCFVAYGPTALALVMGDGADNVTLSPALKTLAVHHGGALESSETWVSFKEHGVKLPAGQKLCLYGIAPPANAGFVSSVSFHLVPADPS